MKTSGVILTIIGIVGFYFYPLIIPLIPIGILVFIQGSENNIVKVTEEKINSSEKLLLGLSGTLSRQIETTKKSLPTSG
jgi:hypothetical protein